MSNAELTRALLQAQMELINIYLANTNRFLEQTKINGYFKIIINSSFNW